MNLSAYLPIKRAIDLMVSACLLVLLSPLFCLVAVTVCVSMGRPVFFRQQRPGLHGEPFTLFKFRTMEVGSGSDGDRITRLGDFLRSSSIDELPELWNVLRGQMSLVGPRPLLMEYLPLYSDFHSRRHEVRPGITGMSQISGRNSLLWDDRLNMDVEYVERCSFVLDLRIIRRTILKVLKREGISEPLGSTMSKFTGSRGAA
ncbi:MAG: sugar transferase [Acidimicrobiales bacterium]